MPLQVKSLAEWEREGIADVLSVVIPAHNEEGHIADTVEGVAAALQDADIRYEILVVNDNSVAMNGSDPGKNFCGNTAAAATPYRKKSYHSIVVPTEAETTARIWWRRTA